MKSVGELAALCIRFIFNEAGSSADIIKFYVLLTSGAAALWDETN